MFDKKTWQREYMRKYRDRANYPDAPIGYAVFAEKKEWPVTGYLIPPEHFKDVIDPIPLRESMVQHAREVSDRAKARLEKV